ncbi:hypothetical protein PF008_g12874 [Phytophthora fragariae]|uniref:Uncharacterized protein n=1 Tax=Phytophthora fragariae TaxID=53985 RepID=A0A6G0RLL2_9STRA|nr:hypothetical protein PF008_g12874 [Phytophthora fragariae]
MKTRAASTVANDCTLDGTSIVAEGCAEARTAVDGCVISSSVVQRYSSGSALEDSCTVGGCLLEGSAAASSVAGRYAARRMLATGRAACSTVKESSVEASVPEGGATVDIREGRGEEDRVGEVVALRDECDSSRSRKCFT